ncbi:MAG TPA: NADPH-dependent FMN reductase [Gammaproteobacteria bacterium]|nr:NADPH-dependent FMN reductase [Gammaproteobacteria bacterium]
MAIKKIAVLIGSLRKGSYNRKVAQAVIKMAPSSLKLEIVEIGNLPLYNEDDDNNPPESYVAFRELIKNFDGLLFVTPEYNRSIPGALKNALDVGSRPYGQSAWQQKPAAIISVSIGAIGGFAANHHLRQALVFLDVPTMQQPEAYIGNAANLFEDNGEFKNKKTNEFLEKFMINFATWVETNCK